MCPRETAKSRDKKILMLAPDTNAEKPAPISADGPKGADTLAEARRIARETVWQNARKLVSDLVQKPSNNYLAVKFLFEFAGLTAGNEEEEDRPDFQAFMQDLLNRSKSGPPKQTSDAKLNLSSVDVTQDA
jgi:hypothetical protein